MAIDVCSSFSNSEFSGMGMSPRISFSQDLDQTDDAVAPMETNARRSDMFVLDINSDFNFCINESFEQEPSSADELFFNGKILPTEIKKKPITVKDIQHRNTPSQHLSTDNATKKRLKEFLAASFEDEEEEENPSSKSFWQFKRSSSLNFDSVKSRSLIRSINFLSRSNSTGSAPNPKQKMLSSNQKDNDNQKQFLKRQPSSSRSTKSSQYYPYNSSPKPPLKNNCKSHYGIGLRISPVLNFPPHYISKGSLFGFGSFFCNGKDKKKKK